MENGGRGRGHHGKKGRKTQRKAPVGLGFKAMQSFVKNQESVEEFIDALENGTIDLSRYSVGRVERGVGASHFEVIQLPSGERIPSAGIIGFLKGGSPAAGTYVGRDSLVILYDSRTGPFNRGRTHTIMGVLAPHQADRVFGLLGIHAAGEEDDLFDRRDEMAAALEELATARSELADMRRSLAATRKSSSSSNAGSVATSRKSSGSSYNLEAEMAAATAAAKSVKKKRQFHTRKERKKAEKEAAKKAAEATGAGGGATWF